MESAAKIKEILQAASMEKLPEFIAEYENDPRSGVQKLVSGAQKKIDALEKERQRIENLKKYEKEYAQYTYICGIDEVGRGPLAGPVVAGAVILPKDCDILYINDSKQLSEKKREELYDVITSYSSSLFFSDNCLESLMYKISQSFGRMTAPATTGPARGPLPTSSIPQI